MTVSARPTDVWNLASFDPDLVDRFAPHAALAVDYYRRDQEIFLTHELGRGSGRQLIGPSNAHAAAFQAFREEVANMFLHIDRPDLLEALAAIGRPRIIEVSAPLAFTQAGYSAAEAVVATFARAQGAIPAKHDSDFYVTAPLGPAAILAVHSEGEPAFAAMGVSHPPDYVNVSVGWWKALTGDDD